jgi:hypothetical protein
MRLRIGVRQSRPSFFGEQVTKFDPQDFANLIDRAVRVAAKQDFSVALMDRNGGLLVFMRRTLRGPAVTGTVNAFQTAKDAPNIHSGSGDVAAVLPSGALGV